MKIYNETKTQEIGNPNLEQGYLKEDKILIKHHEAQTEVQEQSHYITVKEYPNGGKDDKKVIDVEYQPQKEAWDEFEDINIFIPYTDSELKSIQISKLKTFLAETDYKAIKFAEGEIPEEEYEPIKQQRKAWRLEINALQNQLPNQAE